MKKRKLLFAAALLFCTAGAWAQTDVTNTYITNAGFEGESQQFLKINTDGRGVQKPIGWSVEWTQGSSSDHNGMTYVGSMNQDSQNWTAHGGDKAYFTRMRWQNSTLTLRQTMVNLLQGDYTLSFYATASKLNDGNGSASVSVAGQSQAITVGSSTGTSWTQYTINFTVTTNPYATIVVTASRTAGNFKFGIDDFTLTYDGSSYYPTILEKAQSLYKDNADWAEGADALSAAITAATGKETVADKNAAIVALEEAMTTFKEANTVDVTNLITNATFDSNISGWTTNGSDGTFQHQTSSQTNFTGGFLESWRNSWNGNYNHKNFNVSQTLSNLPNGEYTIKAAIIAVMQGSAESKTSGTWEYQNMKHGGPYYIDDEKGVWLYGISGENSGKAWANTKNSAFDGDGAEYKTTTVKVENGSLTIGFKGIGSEGGGTSLGTYANWIACDNWTLSYFGFDPSTLKSQISDLKNNIQVLIDGDEVPTAVKTSLQNTLDNLVETPETKTILNAAVSTLETAISAANATKDPYGEYKALKAIVEDLKNESKYTFTGTEALSTFNSTLSDIDSEAEAATDAATLTDLLPSLKTAGNTFVGAIESNDSFDLTYNIENNSFETGALSPWTTNGSNDTGVKPNSNGIYTTTGVDGDYLFNTWNNGAGSKVSQTLTSLPNGYYTVTALVASDAGNTINILAGASTKGIASDATDGKTQFVEGTTDKVLVSDGSLEIGTNSTTWYKSDYFRLTYYTVKAGAAEAWATAKAAAEEAYANDDYVNVIGIEKTNLKTEIDKAEPTTVDAYGPATTALQEATSAFIAAKDSYDAYASAKATAEGVNEADVLAVVIEGNDEATAADALAASEILPKAFTIKAATYSVPVVTDFVVNGTFDDSDISMWSCNTSFQNRDRKTTDDNNAGNMNNTKPWWENWNGSALVNKMSQTISNIPNGTYRLDITAFVNNFNPESQYVFANSNQTSLTEAARTGAAYEVYTVVTNNQVEVGLEQTTATANWMGIDNVSLRYYGAGDVVNDAKNASHKLAWTAAHAAAEEAYANDDYVNVIGIEKTNLKTEIDKAEPSTADDYDAATAALESATSTFIAAAPAYTALDTEIDYAKTLSVNTETAEAAQNSEASAASVTAAVQALKVLEYTSLNTTYPNDVTTSLLGSWSAGNYGTTSGQGYSGSESYFDKWNGSAMDLSSSKTVTLPAGNYVIRVAGRGVSTTTMNLSVKVGDADAISTPFLMIGDTGKGIDTSGATNFSDEGTYSNGNAGRGWQYRYITFTTDGTAEVVVAINGHLDGNTWQSFYAPVLLCDNTTADNIYAGSAEYAALNSAISTAEANTLGFEDGQYAPYNNVAALEALAAAKAIGQDAELTNLKTDVEAATTALTSAVWTANEGDVDAIYNGNFAIANGTNPKGWTRSNSAWGQQITGLSAATNGVDAETTTAWYYNTEGAWEYGKDGVYTMPLAASQAYKLTFKYRSHAWDSNNFMKASILNASNEGLVEVTFAKNADNTNFVTATAYFTTGAAGNYILSLTQSGNTHLTDVSLVKVASATLALDEDDSYNPVDRTYYETVTLDRTIKADTWNTFVVPFDITNEELVAKFGAEVAVAEFSDAGASADAVTVSFTKMGTPAITANTPALLKGNAGTEFTFNDKLIKTGDAKVEGNYLDFVGTYDASTTIASGDFFISGNKLYKSSGATTIQGTRAYLHDKSGAGVKAMLFIDDEATGIESLNVNDDLNDAIYNVAGQRMSKMQKGINIVNGKKVLY